MKLIKLLMLSLIFSVSIQNMSAQNDAIPTEPPITISTHEVPTADPTVDVEAPKGKVVKEVTEAVIKALTGEDSKIKLPKKPDQDDWGGVWIFFLAVMTVVTPLVTIAFTFFFPGSSRANLVTKSIAIAITIAVIFISWKGVSFGSIGVSLLGFLTQAWNYKNNMKPAGLTSYKTPAFYAEKEKRRIADAQEIAAIIEDRAAA